MRGRPLSRTARQTRSSPDASSGANRRHLTHTTDFLTHLRAETAPAFFSRKNRRHSGCLYCMRAHLKQIPCLPHPSMPHPPCLLPCPLSSSCLVYSLCTECLAIRSHIRRALDITESQTDSAASRKPPPHDFRFPPPLCSPLLLSAPLFSPFRVHIDQPKVMEEGKV